MTIRIVPPPLVNLGDNIIVGKNVYSVTSIQGPDSHGVYDAYLTSPSGQMIHEVISEPTRIIME